VAEHSGVLQLEAMLKLECLFDAPALLADNGPPASVKTT
jgi:hypothetical protein